MDIKVERAKTKIFSRFIENVEIKRQHGDPGSLRFPASSEEPVERWYGMEILSHDDGAIRLKRAKNGAMPLLFNHDIDDPIGMIAEAKIEHGRLMVDAQLFETDRAKEIEKMLDGGLHNVSIAYRTYEVTEDKEEKTFTATDWEPYEVSIVTVPADYTVGIGRLQENEYEIRMVRFSQTADNANKQEGRMKPGGEEKTSAGATAITEQPEKTGDNTGSEQRSLDKTQENAEGIEKRRTGGIENLCKAYNLDEKFRDHWISRGTSLDEVAKEIVKIMENRTKANPQSIAKIGLSEKDTKRFSLNRAILAMHTKEWKNAQFEMEVSRITAERLNKPPEPDKLYIPFEVLQRPIDQEEMVRLAMQMGRRDLTVATAGAGGYLVETTNLGFIDMLRNRSVVLRMGARRLPGLIGNVNIPRMSAAGTAYWLSTEGTAITESQQTFVQVALTPKNVGAYTEISRQLLIQSSPGAEGIVTSDLAAIVAIAADLGAINGSGAAGQPTGIINTSGIGAVTGTSLGYAGVLNFQEDVASANVMPMSGGYVTTPAVASLMMQRSRFTNTDTPLWVGNIWNGAMAGFPSMSSLQIPTADMLFGDWTELVIAEWGVLEVELNPYANFPAGIVGIRAMYTMDVGVRIPAAFSLATTIT